MHKISNFMKFWFMEQIWHRFWATAWTWPMAEHTSDSCGLQVKTSTPSPDCHLQGRSLGMVKVELWGVGYSPFTFMDWKLPVPLTQLSRCVLHNSTWHGCRSAPALTAWLCTESRFDTLSDIYSTYQIFLACGNLSGNWTLPVLLNKRIGRKHDFSLYSLNIKKDLT